MSRWPLVLADLAAIHHLPPSAVLEQPWPGLQALILDLLSDPASRLRRSLRG